MRRAARVDANQAEIIKALRGAGASVFPTHAMGGGFPDLVVGYRGINYLLEIKDGSLRPSKQRRTKGEERFDNDWRGTVHLVNSSLFALEVIGVRELVSPPENGG